MGLEITLNPPNICLVTAQSLREIVPDSENYKFGSVYQINPTTYNCQVGDLVMFDRTKAVLVTQQEGSVPPSYFLIDQEDFEFIENPIP